MRLLSGDSCDSKRKCEFRFTQAFSAPAFALPRTSTLLHPGGIEVRGRRGPQALPGPERHASSRIQAPDAIVPVSSQRLSMLGLGRCFY